MAARKRYLCHPDETRKKIQVSMLINRLQANAIAEEEFMTANQIACARILLDKSLPSLQSTELSGNADNPLAMQVTAIEHTIVRPDDRKTKTKD